MTLSVYNFVWRIIRPLIPVLLWYRVRQGKEVSRLQIERYGGTKQTMRKPGANGAGRIWLHAVSVGESLAALRLAQALGNYYPSYDFLITTNTNSGYEVISAGIAEQPGISIHCAMQPFDHPDFVENFLTSWEPSAAIFLESDFWPNLILLSKKRGLPIIFASSQLSAKAFASWKKHPSLAKTLFTAADLIIPVDVLQASHFRELIGAQKTMPKIQVIDH